MRIPTIVTAGIIVVISLSSHARAQSFLKRLEQNINRYAPVLSDDSPQGEPGYLGLTAEDDADGVDTVVVAEVRPSSPALTAGLERGDRIVSIDGRTVSRLEDMDQIMATARAGSTLRFRIERNGEPQDIAVKLTTGPPVAEDLPPPQSVPVPPPGSAFERPSLGVTVSTVTNVERQRYGLSVRSGALVTSVRPASPADVSSIPVGAVIVAVNGVRIDTSDQLVAYIRGRRAGDALDVSYFEGNQMRQARVSLVGSPVVPAGPLPPSSRTGLTEALRQPLVPGTRRPAAPPDTDPIVPGSSAADRPVLRRLEQALDGIIDGRAPLPAGNSEAETLRNEIRILQQQVIELQRRVEALEAKGQE